MWSERPELTSRRDVHGNLKSIEVHVWEAHGFGFSVLRIGSGWTLHCPALGYELVPMVGSRDAAEAKLNATKVIGERLRKALTALRETVKTLDQGSQ